MDVPSAADDFAWYAEAIDKLYDEVAPAGPGALALVTREPLGRRRRRRAVELPADPHLLEARRRRSPPATPSCSSPPSSRRCPRCVLAELAVEAGLPDGVLNVVAGLRRGRRRRRSAGTRTSTRSPSPGRTRSASSFLAYAGRVQRQGRRGRGRRQVAAARAGRRGDLDAAASAIAWGIFYNAGQTCHAGSRLVVHRSVREELLERVAALGRKLVLGDPLDPATRLGLDRRLTGSWPGSRLRRPRAPGGRHGRRRRRARPGGVGRLLHRRRPCSTAWPTDMRRRAGGDLRPGPDRDRLRRRATRRSRLANDTPLRPRRRGVDPRRHDRAHRVARRLRAGTVWVNTFDTADITVPFGGFKQSGFGRDKGLHALDGYTQLKTTWFDLTGG